MARARNNGNGHVADSLEAMRHALAQMLQTMANLNQAQAALLARAAQTDGETTAISRRGDEINRLNAERFDQVNRRFEQVDKRFEQVDRRFEQIDHRLDRIEAILTALPEAVHRRFGFQPPQPPAQ